tara:strand:+ start:3850 stop:4122 length:273 start_codon:yes stop_codon:yes gene_type:complete
MNKKLLIFVFGFASLLFFAGCQTTNEGNFIARCYILDKNEKSITIEHSDYGKGIAFQKAREWAESFNKTAVYKGSSQQYGADVISTWGLE